MAIDQANVIDWIGIDPETEEVLLMISDHTKWNESDQHDREHMFSLQEKINAYLRFIESGELYSTYPKAGGKTAVIKIIAKYEMNESGKRFFAKIKEFLFASGHKITFELLMTN